MAAARRTPTQQRELNDLLTRDHTLNGAILFGLDGYADCGIALLYATSECAYRHTTLSPQLNTTALS